MKILRIRLVNLNSLRGEHVVDFERGPLAQAGLFLIAGPTGAGKSTLLDAITLALYGRAARYARDPNPEDMMTRFCGECQAEVEFEVAAGRYRAEWQLRRSRGKADGAIQPAKRYVYDANGQTLTQHIREAEELIEKLVGLDYQRFLRSALLAQGEFARFLNANPDERAELLESLTGTVIYAELSRLAHEETARRESALNDKGKDLARAALLSPERRLELGRLIEERETARARQRLEVEGLNRQFAQAQELGRGVERERSLLSDQAALEQRAQSVASDMALLAQHRLALPYLEDLNHLEASEREVREQERRLSIAQESRDRAFSGHVDGVLAAGDFAAALMSRGADAVKEAEQRARGAERQQQRVAEWLEGHGADRSLSASLPEIATQLRALETGRKDAAKDRARTDNLAAAARQQAAKSKAAANALTEARELLRRRELEKAAAAQQLESLLQGKTLEARENEIDVLRVQVEVLGKLIMLEESKRAKQRTIDANRNRLAELQIKVQQAQGAATVALGTRETAERGFALRQDHLHRARLAASFEAHRAALKAGEPCPLCGATEHPWTNLAGANISEDILEAEVRRGREELATAETSWRAADRAVTTLNADHAGLAQTLVADATELEALRERSASMAAASGIASEVLENLSVFKTQRSGQVEALRQEYGLIRGAIQALDESDKVRLRADGQSRLAEQAWTAAEGTLAQYQAQAREQAEASASLQQRLAATWNSLTDLLRPYAVPPPEPGQERAVLDQLTERRNQYQGREESLRQTAAALDAARQATENAKRALEVLDQRTAPLREEARLRALAPESLRLTARAALASQWSSLEEAEQAARQRASALTAAEAAMAQRKQEFQRVTEARQQAAARLEARLAGSAFASLAALSAARLEDEASARIERLEQQLRRDAEAIQVRLAEVRGRIRELREAKTVEGGAVQELAARLQDLQRSTEELAAGIRLDQDTLQRDQVERERQAVLAAELEQDRQRLLVWQRLHGLIGSHDGRKFRRYAQGLSLDALVEHANRHLARLTDRYRMRRQGGEELELEIEDLYQAGVKRPMASLSGGESFLASLALALGLAALAGRSVRIDSLFIDEGFGSLDADTLDTAISALETLRQDAKTVGVVSHVDTLKERITTQILVEKLSGGASNFRIVA